MAGRFDKFWELTEGGPYEPGNEIFKCTECGAETHHPAGWNGEPDPHLCRPGCSCKESDYAPGRLNSAYKRNFDRIFPNAPGAGI